MFRLSTRAKEAIKLGLSIVIAYGIALRMDWANPQWAGFAIVMISLPTAGQSLNKGALRMLGTLLGGAAALTLLALFPQDRWAFMALLSVYIAFCTYMMTGGKHQYFWMVAGFVSLVICLSGPEPETAFNITALRVLETALGIIVYTLVSVFLWPQTSATDLGKVTLKLLETQRQVYHRYRDMMTGESPNDGPQALQAQEFQLLAQLQNLLDAAASERYEVQVLRRQWKELIKLSTAIAETLEQWREGFSETKRIDVVKMMPDLPTLHAELDHRFEQMARMLGEEAPDRSPQPVTIAVDSAGARALSHFEKAAIAVTQSRLLRLETLSCALFECIEDLKGYTIRRLPAGTKPPLAERLVLDPDRVQGVVMVLATLWVSFSIWIYVDPPGHVAWLQLPVTLAFALAQMPQLRAWTLVLAFVVGIPLAGVLYVFVMPHLSGYVELGLMLFFAFVVVNYVFWKPQQALTKLACNASIVSLVIVQNPQTYSFAAYANSAAFMLMAISLLVATSHVPFSPRPEKAFLRLLRRFFRSAEFLVATMAYESSGQPARGAARRTAYHRKQISILPRKLGIWARGIDYRVLPDTTPEQVQAVVTNLQALAYRLLELHDARTLSQADIFVRELLEDLRAWRLAVQGALRRFAGDPAGESVNELKERVGKVLATLEARIEETLNLQESESLSDDDYRNFYRLLGAFRGLNEAGLDYAGVAHRMNWSQWREARF